MTEKEQVEQMAKDLQKGIDGLKVSIDKKADVDVLEAKHAELTARLDKLVKSEDFVKQQTQLDEISTQLKKLGEVQDQKAGSIADQLTKYLSGDTYKTAIKEGVAAFRKGVDFVVKAADLITTDINSGTIEAQVETGVSAAPWRGTPIWDNIGKGVIAEGRDAIAWWEETTRTDSAEMVAEDAKPSATSVKTWTKQTMNINRIFNYTKVSRNALEDWEYTRSEILDLIGNGIPRKRETQLLSGTGLTVYLKGLTAYAKTFAKPANFNAVTSPNEGDVLAAAVLQCMNGYTTDTNKQGYMPNVIFLNPGDKINMRLLKSTIESYLQHPMLSLDGTRFEGILLVPSLDLSAGQFVVGDLSRAKVYVKRNLNISFHYENEDDALYDRVLCLASMRLAGIKISAADAYGFVTGTFAAGKPLITP
jgi:HK97 family phage major capsid protein